MVHGDTKSVNETASRYQGKSILYSYFYMFDIKVKLRPKPFSLLSISLSPSVGCGPEKCFFFEVCVPEGERRLWSSSIKSGYNGFQ